MRTEHLLVALTMLSAGFVFSESAIEPDLVDQVIWQYAAIRDPSRIPPWKVLNFVKSNNVEKCVFYGAVSNKVCNSKAEVEGGVNPFAGMHFRRMMWLIAEIRDRDWTPFLLQIYRETKDNGLKCEILRAYALIAKDESVGLLEEALDGNVVESGDRFYIWEAIGGQYGSVDEKRKKKISAFLLRQMEKETGTSNQKKLEDILSANSAEYRTSKQRKKYAERFLNSGHAFAQDLGRTMMKEIEKTPPSKRADLSELLKNPKNETTGE